MRTDVARSLVLLALAGGAGTPGPATATAGTATARCHAPGSQRGDEPCREPADVRAFIDDRVLCDHFRSEPWPEEDDDASRERRRQLVEGARRACEGTDARLAALKARYATDPAVLQVLSGFEDHVED